MIVYAGVQDMQFTIYGVAAICIATVYLNLFSTGYILLYFLPSRT